MKLVRSLYNSFDDTKIIEVVECNIHQKNGIFLISLIGIPYFNGGSSKFDIDILLYPENIQPFYSLNKEISCECNSNIWLIRKAHSRNIEPMYMNFKINYEDSLINSEQELILCSHKVPCFSKIGKSAQPAYNKLIFSQQEQLIFIDNWPS